MRSQKRYSNVTFTKRVDHEGGRHRTPRSPDEPVVCSECGAAYVGRRWVGANVKAKIGKRERLPRKTTVCYACRQAQSRVAGGYLYLDGGFVIEHRGEIEHLLRNTGERAAVDNPLARIMGWESAGDQRLIITTTTERLAQRLGHALQKAFSGEVRYDFSHENKLARVYWHRD